MTERVPDDTRPAIVRQSTASSILPSQYWTELTFGQYVGSTLPQVVFRDPDWFFWAWQKRLFSQRMCAEASKIHGRATSIRIPTAYGSDTAIEYSVERRTRRFGGMQVVPAATMAERGTFILPVIDMSVPRSLSSYDKSGMRMLIHDLKEIVFGDPNMRMSKRRAEEFFCDDCRFAVDAAKPGLPAALSQLLT